MDEDEQSQRNYLIGITPQLDIDEYEAAIKAKISVIAVEAEERRKIVMQRSRLMMLLLTMSLGWSAGLALLAALGIAVIVGMATGWWVITPWFLPMAVVVAVCMSTAVGLLVRSRD